MSMLHKLGITVNPDGLTEEVFNNLFENFLDISYEKPSEYISIYWDKFQSLGTKTRSLNGKIFEYILCTLCVRENLLPLYMSAKVAFVPNVIYDLMFYTSEYGPVCISAKTSLRERYKQADLEAIALKYVHRKALSYLVTLNDMEAANVKRKIKSGDVIGIDEVVVATSEDFDDMISKFKQLNFFDPPTVKVIQSTQIITEDKVSHIRDMPR